MSKEWTTKILPFSMPAPWRSGATLASELAADRCGRGQPCFGAGSGARREGLTLLRNWPRAAAAGATLASKLFAGRGIIRGHPCHCPATPLRHPASRQSDKPAPPTRGSLALLLCLSGGRAARAQAATFPNFFALRWAMSWSPWAVSVISSSNCSAMSMGMSASSQFTMIPARGVPFQWRGRLLHSPTGMTPTTVPSMPKSTIFSRASRFSISAGKLRRCFAVPSPPPSL
mmetsp:Transcript_3317/g.8963  ORF Transcript_3317/g.8963 Transcript_3317/m.8963 type:complete len:230 (+) Transcript_3317:158-847(+)